MKTVDKVHFNLQVFFWVLFGLISALAILHSIALMNITDKMSCEEETKEELIMIDLSAVVDIDYKETDLGFDSLLVCNITSGMCGNDVYYNKGKGFIWGGLHNASGVTVSAKISDANEVQDE